MDNICKEEPLAKVYAITRVTKLFQVSKKYWLDGGAELLLSRIA